MRFWCSRISSSVISSVLFTAVFLMPFSRISGANVTVFPEITICGRLSATSIWPRTVIVGFPIPRSMLCTVISEHPAITASSFWVNPSSFRANRMSRAISSSAGFSALMVIDRGILQPRKTKIHILPHTITICTKTGQESGICICNG